MNVHTWEAVRYSVCVGVTVALDKEMKPVLLKWHFFLMVLFFLDD
jgi:hypothetical protein